MSNWDTDDRREFLKSFLSNQVMLVRFTKRDGSERVMLCTRDMKLIPEENHPKGANFTENPDVLRVWSTDDEGWRSFRYDSVLTVVPAMALQEESV